MVGVKKGGDPPARSQRPYHAQITDFLRKFEDLKPGQSERQRQVERVIIILNDWHPGSMSGVGLSLTG
jgi:hypothetical protein